MTVSLLTKPQLTHLDQLKKHLKHEEGDGQVGFYCNWNLIVKGFENGDLYCLVDENAVVGFSLCSIYEKTGRLEIMEVLAKYRLSGYGRVLVERSLTEFRARGVLVVEIECAPSESEPFWRHMGFMDITPGANPNDRYQSSDSYSSPKLYAPIVDFTQVNAAVGSKGDTLSVELWQGEPWETEGLKPNWYWSVPMSATGQLQSPIIHPANKNWRVRICREDRVLHDDKIKRLSDERHRWGYNLIVESLAVVKDVISLPCTPSC